MPKNRSDMLIERWKSVFLKDTEETDMLKDKGDSGMPKDKSPRYAPEQTDQT